ncbi:Alpha-mannosidase I MNS4 [Dichanthelium oligosanthes]|uniref:alpha-1,2-Mannosidase n=1 Tax=Dichanthelium oligosanthes TaxID=888268 RepID=A0A1E5VES1_9POAL|nr:Alpha-mannosidase I MNS4 [Dichanthelium oligosanthes]
MQPMRRRHRGLPLLCLSAALVAAAALLPDAAVAEGVTPFEARRLRDEVKDMFYHAFDGYMKYAFPLDELRPLSCQGEDSLGGYALTLIDSLDTLALLGDKEKFGAAVEWVGKNVRFDINKTVSVFETNIRILGGLLSAHLIASDYATGMRIQSYDDQLLHLASDLAQRLLPAFDTPTGIPFGSVNLKYGVDENESKASFFLPPFFLSFTAERLTLRMLLQITSTAGGGTLTLEFGILSRLTNNTVFEQVTKNSVRGIWSRRSKLNLVGAHINVFTGEWTQKDAGIGTSIDSFYEYLLKAKDGPGCCPGTLKRKINTLILLVNIEQAYLLFGDEEYLYIFQEAYKAAMHYLHHDPWYVEVNMNSGATVWPLFNSLQAFWPGLQVLAGDVDPAIRTHAAFFSVWKKYGFTPEGFNLATSTVQNGQRSYPLRPELIESTYWLFKATRDYRYLDVGRDILTSLQYGARCPCGYCHISDVETHKQDDHMESFFLAETVKYLWLLFDLAAGPDNIVENGPYKYIFSTEGHLLPVTPEIALIDEHCSYFGAFCNGGEDRGYGTSASSTKHQKANYTSHYSASNMFTTRGYIKGVCPGLTHAQKLGISYSDEEGNDIEQTSKSHEHHGESAVESSVQAQSSSIILISHQVATEQDEALESRSGSRDHADIAVAADSDSDSITRDNTDASLGAYTEELTEDTKRTSEQTEDKETVQNFQSKENIS